MAGRAAFARHAAADGFTLTAQLCTIAAGTALAVLVLTVIATALQG